MKKSSSNTSAVATNVQSRKARRKEERSNKKQKKKKLQQLKPKNLRPAPAEEVLEEKEAGVTVEVDDRRRRLAADKSSDVKVKKKRKLLSGDVGNHRSQGGKSISNSDDPYSGLDPDVAAAMRNDDQEIAEMEAKLGLRGGSKQKQRLKREYAKLEGFGEDFGDFLESLDTLARRIYPTEGKSYSAQLAKEEESEKWRTLYGDGDEENSTSSPSRSDEDDDSDQVVPMKDPADDDDSVMEEIEAEEELARLQKQRAKDLRNRDDDDDDDDDVDRSETEVEAIENAKEIDIDSESESASLASSSPDDDDDGDEREVDHDKSFTYRPTKGEDIYGNKLDPSGGTGGKPGKYVPPHMRNKVQRKDDSNNEEQGDDDDNDERRQEQLRVIRRSLNNALNRLSEDTLVSVSQSIAQLYPEYPSSDINENMWKFTRNACVATGSVQMTTLIPVYVAALTGVHVQKGDAAQLGEYVMEKIVRELMQDLESARRSGSSSQQQQHGKNSDDGDGNDRMFSKETSNLTLLLCYLYNFGVIHCSLLYDIIRDLIANFGEVDVEMLLLILSHSGRALRSDDPSSLKEIVLAVQKRALEGQSKNCSNQSRVDYMVSAMMDLKNNKRRKQDVVYSERTAKLRKMVGKIKCMVVSSSSNVRASDSSLRITLKDILNADTNGRWWKVGASWVGNQHRYQGEEKSGRGCEGGPKGVAMPSAAHQTGNKEEERILKLGAKYRMNTDTRRSIFCIIMGSADCDDSFEKLARAGMLKNRTERETVRVLVECCSNEKSYNKYYSHLASRICEFQPQCKFTFQLSFWDAFKQFDEMKVRKAANLAKLLFHLVAVHQCLRLDVLKALDMSSPDDLPEPAMIFLTIFFSSVFDHYGDPVAVSNLFKHGITQRKRKRKKNSKSDGDDDVFGDGDASDSGDDGDGDCDDFNRVVDESEALRANLTVFFVQVLKSSPKYKKGSKFRSNLKAAIKACDTDNFFT